MWDMRVQKSDFIRGLQGLGNTKASRENAKIKRRTFRDGRLERRPARSVGRGQAALRAVGAAATGAAVATAVGGRDLFE